MCCGWKSCAEKRSDPVSNKERHLTCEQTGDIQLDFPATPASPAQPPPGLIEALGIRPSFVGQTKFDKFLLLDSEGAVRGLKRDFAALGPYQGTAESLSRADPVICVSISFRASSLRHWE